MSSWIDRRINLPFRSGAGSSLDNIQMLDKQDIELNLVKAQELRRLKTMRKKWFVLYEDPNEPIDPSRQTSNHRKAQRRRTDGSEVEPGRELSENDPVDDDNENSTPARLEYYDSERKWREGALPKKQIILKKCFDINRKKETANQYVLTVYTLNEGLDILFENETDMEVWLDLMLCCKNGGRSIEGKIARPLFESVWSVEVIGFTPDQTASSSTFQMNGPHRLCVTEGNLHFYPVGKQTSITFLMREIRMFGSDKRKFRFIMGSNSVSGVGELAMWCKDRETSENLQQYIRIHMARLQPDAQDTHSRSSRRQGRSSHHSRSDWSSDSSVVNGRTRSYSDCNKKNSPLARSIPIQKSHLAQLQETAARNRTVSEGTGNLDNSGKNRWHRPNVLSGSPLSPGSFISSESAGSSNSVDSDTMPVGSFDNYKYGSTCMTPSSEHPTHTIIEESSAESCIDPANFKHNQRMDDVKEVETRRPSLPMSCHEIHYTPVDVGPATKVEFPTIVKTSSSFVTSRNCTTYASSPPGSSDVLYSTIVGTAHSTPAPTASDGGTDYMVMTPVSSVSQNSSLRRNCQVEPERKRLSILGLDDEPFPTMNAQGVTSPISQSSLNPAEEDESSYLVMSPTGTLPKKSTSTVVTSSAVAIPSKNFHQRTDSFPSGSAEAKEDTQYMMMSPTVAKVSIQNGKSRGATSLGTSPSAALTSHFSDKLPLYEPLKHVNQKTESSEEIGGYLVMSPVNVENVDKTPKISWMAEKFRASSVDTSGPPLLRSKDHYGVVKKDAYKRSSLCSEDDVPRGWSPTSNWPPTTTSQDSYNPIEDYEDFEPPKAPYYHHHHSRPSKSTFIPISNTRGRRASPASSSSFISGTPNSTESGNPKRPTIDDDLVDDDGSETRHGKVSIRASNSSLSSRNSGSRFIDIPGAGKNSVSPNVSAQSSVTSTTNSGMASWLSSLFRSRADSGFRNRSDSVPSRPPCQGRRRHRTQSEGENVEDHA